MLKAKFIDKILEAMQDEADRIFISRRDVDIYYKNLKDDKGNAEISEFIQSLNLEDQVGEYRIRIDYEHEIVEIHKGTKLISLANFIWLGNTELWTKILEEIENDKKKKEGK